jgi:hypothetical protein
LIVGDKWSLNWEHINSLIISFLATGSLISSASEAGSPTMMMTLLIFSAATKVDFVCTGF